jgi:hypothetical protein
MKRCDFKTSPKRKRRRPSPRFGLVMEWSEFASLHQAASGPK